MVSLTAWCSEIGDGGLRGQAETLERALFAAGEPGESWDGRRFAAAIAGARKTWRASHDRPAGRSRALTALNP
jgi:hypothetical protein